MSDKAEENLERERGGKDRRKSLNSKLDIKKTNIRGQ